jgi:hypothetical protein
VVYRTKNRVIWSLNAASAATNVLFVWDYYNNAWSKYTGFNATAMAIFLVSGYEERPYFQGRIGMTYRMDDGHADYINGSASTINAYYYTNWKSYGDIVNQKGVPHIYVYYTAAEAEVTLAYSYDFEEGDTYSTNFSTSGGDALWDTFVWDDDNWVSSGGGIKRIDLTGRGRTIRFKFANISSGQTFRIDALGQFPHLETKA